MNCWYQSPLCLYWITLMYITSLTCTLSLTSVWNLHSQVSIRLMGIASLEFCFSYLPLSWHHNDPWGTFVALLSLMIKDFQWKIGYHGLTSGEFLCDTRELDHTMRNCKLILWISCFSPSLHFIILSFLATLYYSYIMDSSSYNPIQM